MRPKFRRSVKRCSAEPATSIAVGIIILLLGLLICIPDHTAHAAPLNTTIKQTGITISPASEQVSIASNETQHQLLFRITNHESTLQTINLTTADFNTLDETGGLYFVGTNPTKLQKEYSLSSWLTLPQTSVSVQPKQTITVTAFILNQPSMAPGGHYGALMLSIASNSSGSSSQNKVSVQPIASALLFVNKVGGDTHILSLSNVYATHSIFSLPSAVTLRFKDDGNTHLIPRGVITITDSSGKLISKGIINEDSDIILPQTYRLYTIPLYEVSKAVRPGKYTLLVNFRFDGYNQIRSYQTSMFLLGGTIFYSFLVLLVMVVVITYFWHKGTFSKIRKYSSRKNK